MILILIIIAIGLLVFINYEDLKRKINNMSAGSYRGHIQQTQQYAFEQSQYEYTPETRLRQEAHFVESGLDKNESELYNLQLVFLIDISGSMQERDVDPEGTGKDGTFGRGQWTRYDNMLKILRNMSADLHKFDKDGKIPVYFFNNEVKKVDITDPNLLIAQVRMMKPGGSTAMHLALKQAVNDQINDIDNILFIVFTDGVPDDTRAVATIIENDIYRKDPRGDRLNILFVRFGDDRGAIQFLNDQDDHPVYGESVDHKSDNAAYILGPKLLVLNALYERIEKDPAWSARLAACQ